MAPSEDNEESSGKRVSLRLPVELADRTDIISDAHRQPRTELIEEAVDAALSVRLADDQTLEHLEAAYERDELSEEALDAVYEYADATEMEETNE